MHLQEFLLYLPVLMFSVIAHEIAHGYAALKQGDETALSLGRLSWNPIRHVDPFMTLILPAMLWFMSGGKVMLGGAKPVPVDPRNYRNYRRGDIIVSLAGVATNLLIAILCVVLFALFGALGRAAGALEMTFGLLQVMMVIGVQLNMVLIAFNLIPIPPLDGSHVVKHILPPRLALAYQRFGRYGILIIIAVLWLVPSVLMVWLSPAFALGDRMLGVVGSLALPTLHTWGQ